jgi:NACalpha-BTF3-like transcription factor
LLAAAAPEDDDEEVDASGIDPKDIEMVMNQVRLILALALGLPQTSLYAHVRLSLQTDQGKHSAEQFSTGRRGRHRQLAMLVRKTQSVRCVHVRLAPLQANVSKSKAVKALRNSDLDIVSAIMELTY